MAPAHGTGLGELSLDTSEGGLGDLSLDTSEGGLGDLSLDTSEGGLGELSLNTSGGGLGETLAGELAGETDAGLVDPWARFTEQLGWDELRVNQTAGAVEPALPAAAEGSTAPRLPMEPAAAFPVTAVPDTAPVPADFPAPSAGRSEPTSAESVTSREIELPTEPARHDKPAAVSREQWRARAQELGLYSVFVAAPDDFGNPAPTAPAAQHPSAPALQPPTDPEPTAALDPVPAETFPLHAVPAEASPLHPVPAESSPGPSAPGAAAALGLVSGEVGARVSGVVETLSTGSAPGDSRSAASVSAVASSPDAEAEQAAVIVPVSAAPATRNRLLGASRQGGSLLRSIQRPTATPLAKELEASVVTEPAPSPLPSPPPAPPASSLFAAEVAQVVKQSLQQGKRLLRQLLRGSVTEPASKDPPVR